VGATQEPDTKDRQKTPVKKTPVMGFVYYAVAVAALGGVLFGYDTGVISGAILFIKRQFSLSSTMEEIVVSAVLVGAVFGASLAARSRTGLDGAGSSSSQASSSSWVLWAQLFLPRSHG
jgi:hypothetical protein